MKVIFLSFVLASSACTIDAASQPLRRVADPFVVETSGGAPYRNPFSGGLWQPRTALRDIDNDGLPELFTLNPDGELRMYRNLGSFVFQRAMPSPYDSLQIDNWFRFADLNGDGHAELLNAGPRSEVMVLSNSGTDAAPRFAEARALTNSTGDTIRTQRETVPSIVDIDNDGDLDLFAGNVDGSISFYRNVGTSASASFTFVTSEYMGILVIAGGIARGDKDSHSALSSRRHGASVLDFADLDNDGDLDLLFGDFFTQKLLHFTNFGTATTPLFSMSRLDTAFRPDGDDVESDGFNQPVTGDIDRDGDLDAVIALLLPTGAMQSHTLYENIGSISSPRMRRRGIDLTSEIDVGNYASPTTIEDASRSGLLVGSWSGRLTYFARTTVGGATVFRSSATFLLPGLFQTSPATGDINGDGLAEVVVGEAGGSIVFHRFEGNVLVRYGDTFQLNRNASPALVDLDSDGDLDLFAGAENGRFQYFENTGTASSSDFVRTTPPSPFDALDVGYDASPRFFDIDNDGDLDAMVGSRTGGASGVRDTLRFFLRDGAGFVESASYQAMSIARNPTAAGISLAEGRFVLVGDISGGIKAFAVHPVGSVRGDVIGAEIRIHQNVDGIEIAWDTMRPLDVHVVDVLGRTVARRWFDRSQGKANIALASVGSGAYIVAANSGDRCAARVIIVR